MKTFPDAVQFRYSWRPYQGRVLSELEEHLDDNHLHVVAAPGSGKTVLGLEVTRRLNQPALILAPTVAIRDQWIDRLLGMFCEPGTAEPDWISRDVREPGFLTVTTYQGLFSATHDRGDEKGKARARVLKTLAAQGIGTLVLDEAHHLRNAWWQCLIAVKEKLKTPTIVSLTATAPFDVSPYEWERYIELCGPIDTEITVPELVREGNLCPHQDLVTLSTPLQSERAEIQEFRSALETYLRALEKDEALIQALEGHPHVQQPRDHAAVILEDPAFYSAVAVFLKQATGQAPRALLRMIGLSTRRCPKFSHARLEQLLAGMLYTNNKSFVLQATLTRRLQKDLARLGAADKRQIELDNPRKVAGRLVTSASKLTSITAIVRLEQASLGDDLRLVILSDYIRREDFPRHAEDLQPIKRLGVVPIFEQLRREALPGLRLGILSGSLIVIPTEALESLQAIAEGMNLSGLRSRPLSFDENYVEVTVGGTDAHRRVHLVTELFNRGQVTALIGTTSLLGEGWDAPSVNTLILASFVGSFMLSNQMRGRAIRTQSGNPTKTANIWHLICQEPDRDVAGPDLELMQRRFEAFSGVTFSDDSIQSGVERLGLGAAPYGEDRIAAINRFMADHAQNREGLRERWQRALDKAKQGQMVEALATDQVTLARRFVFVNTLLALLWQGWFMGWYAWAHAMRAMEDRFNELGWKAGLLLVMIASGAAVIVALPWCLKALWLFLRHAPVAGSVKQIGKAVLRALIAADHIETRLAHLRVMTHKQGQGAVSCTLQGATTRERTVFLEALQEVLGPIENPRYLLVRKTPLLKWFRKDTHAVPKALARNKEAADAFQRYWSRFVGPTTLIYTRNEEGRRRLLHARSHSLSTAFTRPAERLRTWE